ncbi:MAG: hypothetical protein IKW03_03085 [Clostridia bacterium]|nr:hypothetical protein [Clostridia bacterium]
MYKKLCENRGAVAVFLVIVLVPMITCATLFVETARVKLAQALVASAGDLTLNTYMTDFDSELNDYYGMLASAQDIDDVNAAIDKYFEACLISQGVDSSYIKNYVNSISGMFTNGGNIADFLNITVNEGSFDVTPTKNGALNNAALIKTEIVDFMKYRSPINAASSLLDSLTNIKNETETMEEQTKCAEEQQDFYETEESLMKTAKKAYDQIKEYEKLKFTKTYVTNFFENIKTYPTDYKNVYVKYVYDLAGPSKLSKFSTQTITEPYTEASVLKYNENNPASWGTTKGLVDDVSEAIQDFVNKQKSLDNLVNITFKYKQGTYSTRYYQNVMAELNKNNQYQNYVSSANNLTKKMAQLKNAYENMEEVTKRDIDLADRSNVNTSGKKTIDAHYSALLSQYNSLKGNFTNSQGSYKVLSNRMSNLYSSISNGNTDIPRPQDGTVGNIDRSKANTMIEGIYNEIDAYLKKITEGKKQVDDAVKTLNKLKELIGTYKTDYNNWKTAANNSELVSSKNEFAAQSRSDIAQREQDPDVMKNLTVENVNTLINRLNNIKSALGEMEKALKDYKFKGKAIKDIKNLDGFGSVANVKDVGITVAEINNYINSNYSFTNANITLQITNNNNPALDVNTPAVYTWMKNKLDNADESKMKKKDAESQYDSLKASKDKNMEDKKDDVVNETSKNEISKSKNLPSKNAAKESLKREKTSELSKLTSFIGDLFGDLGKTLSGAATTVRDNLYTVDYIMSMFSYDTYVSEGLLEMWKNDHPNDSLTSTTDFKSAYTEKWKKPGQTDHFHKSLTNHIIDTSTCYSYGNEVEYILYGKTNTANKSAAYATIYMIRLALDMGPIFSKFFNDSAVRGLATAISAATSGVIPVPVIKFAICLGLTAMEAGMDLSYIKKGLGVPLLKSKEQLFTTFSKDGSMNSNTNDDALGVGGLFLQYSDYLQILLFMSLLSSDKADAIYLRIADVVQVNIDQINGDKSFLMSKAQVYFSLKADITVKPLLFPVPLIDNYMSSTGSDNKSIKSSKGYKNLEKVKWNSFTYSTTRGY